MTFATPPQTRLVAAIAASREELAELTLRLSALPDLSGLERPVAEAVAEWFAGAGIAATVDRITVESANVRAALGDAIDGPPALILSSHLDTEGAPPEGDEAERRRLRGAWRDGDLLVGKGLVNDKTQLAAMLVAIREVDRLGLPLTGGLAFLGTAQECGAPVEPARPRTRDEGPHMAEGHGARWALAHGTVGRSALVGEPTGFAICAAQAGYLRVRVTVPGFVPYTPFVHRVEDPLDTDNAFERAGEVIRRLTVWAHGYERRERVAFRGGFVAPKAQIQEIRRAAPLFTQADDPCDIYVDIRTAPGRDDDEILADLAAALDGLPYACAMTPYDRASGHVAVDAEPLIEAVEAAHRTVFGRRPEPPRDPQTSMWHDTNALNEAGIPAVSYGIRPLPEPWTRERTRSAHVDDVVRLAQVYALTALAVCATGGSAVARPDVD